MLNTPCVLHIFMNLDPLTLTKYVFFTVGVLCLVIDFQTNEETNINIIYMVMGGGHKWGIQQLSPWGSTVLYIQTNYGRAQENVKKRQI